MANAVTRERNSNHELMRILSMFFIVLGHVFLFGRLLDTPNKSMSIIRRLDRHDPDFFAFREVLAQERES